MFDAVYFVSHASCSYFSGLVFYFLFRQVHVILKDILCICLPAHIVFSSAVLISNQSNH